MRQSKKSFRHESLQDAKTIQDILKSVTKGLAKEADDIEKLMAA